MQSLTPRHIILDAIRLSLPRLFAVLIFAVGAVLILSVFAPIDPESLPMIKAWLPLQVVEASHLLGTVIGVLMIFVARGLWERIDTAWYAGIALFILGAISSLTREFDYVDALIMATCALIMVPCKRAFFRRSNLMSLDIHPGFMLASLLMMIGLIIAGFYTYQRVPYAHALWGYYDYEASVSRFLRALVAIVVTVLVFGLYRLFGLAHLKPELPGAEDMSRVAQVLSVTDQPQAWLALLGDKHILWNDSHSAFLMYGITGRHWVVLGEPVGPESEASALSYRIKALSSMANAKLAFYEVGPKSLPLMLDLGLSPYKIGEEAMIDVQGFELSGKKGYGFRQTLRKYEALEAVFEVIPPEAFDAHAADLKAISDAWLKAKGAREKAYSLGTFDEAYVRHLPIAVIRLKGEIMAFATLWPTHDRSALSLDLMRYRPDSPSAIMEYLFLRLIGYARDEGFSTFSLGLAPLGGLEATPLSNLWYRLGTLISALGAEFYNFKGLRAYKDKFHPRWEPRYLAIQGRETALLPALMAVVTLGNKLPDKSAKTAA
jgi:phosphatidylglycerol lysyltransferase